MSDEIEQAFRQGYIEGHKDNAYAMMNRQIANHYGFEHQTLKAIEECLELALAAIRVMQGSPDVDNLTEETADVLNVTDQLRHFLGAERVDKIRSEKIQRQFRRMADE